VVFALVSAPTLQVYGWSNGGYSADPANPDYGTHDWIAHHALDWLPIEEKQYILDNFASYLYGTELPDNWQPADGIGDKSKHHVYYWANGSIQDDAAAIRAQEEYENASIYALSGDESNASKSLGIMIHYLCDVAVFGHVMGESTDWGKENDTIHSGYESFVNVRTNNYIDDFDTFLVFDGALNTVSAYNATLMLAYDTTFDSGDLRNCTWMHHNYNWTDPDFRSRCGESLNLAVNLVADTLHTFYAQIIIPEFPPPIILPMFMIATLLAVLIVGRRAPSTSQ